MGGYRHEDHAGNFADVHKHVLLRLLIREQRKLPGPITYIETHAGAGWYELTSGGAWQRGLGRLRGRDDLPETVADYVAACRIGYPGSPLHAAELLAEEDRLVLLERDETTARRLASWVVADERVRVIQGDGFVHVPEQIEEHQGRIVLLLDPPYVEAADYRRVAGLINQLADGSRNVVLSAWYPIWRDGREQVLHASLEDAVGRHILDLVVGGQPGEMRGSGLLVSGLPEPAYPRALDTNRWLEVALA